MSSDSILSSVLPQRLCFAANLPFLFSSIENISDRYQAAKNAGFTGVECGVEVYNEPIINLIEAKESSGVEQVLLNSFSGESYGLAAIPSRQSEFLQCLELSIEYCKALKCKRLHILAGQYPENVDFSTEIQDEYTKVYVSNLKIASERLQMDSITLLVEPISTIQNYFLTSTNQAVEIVNELNCDNVKLQLDLYHHQTCHGNIVETLTKHFDSIGHIQISQVPGRHEPDQNGEINYKFIFQHLQKLTYQGWIGCEYIPSAGSMLNLDWLRPYTV